MAGFFSVSSADLPLWHAALVGAPALWAGLAAALVAGVARKDTSPVVAWRIARLMRLGRSCPQLDAQLMFEPDECKAAFILNKQKLPDKPPTLNEVVRLVARLGGFLARTGDGEPGVKTIWLGMQRVLDFAAGIRFSRELHAQGTCV